MAGKVAVRFTGPIIVSGSINSSMLQKWWGRKRNSRLLRLLLSAALALAGMQAKAQCYLGDCTSGWGTYVWESGEEYTGQWVNGKRTGLGVYDWPDGSFYIGYFADDLLHGRGIYISGQDGPNLVGLFEQGNFVQKLIFDTIGCILGNCFNGAGVYIWENAEMYIGQWKNGRRTGYGRYDWADRSSYIGEFRDGMLEGMGEYTGADGQRLKGIFRANELVTPVIDSLPAADSISAATLCAELNQLLVHFVGNFESIKGERISGEYRLAESWRATVSLSNCQQALVVDPPGSAGNQYQCLLLRSAPLQQTMSLYYALSDALSACTLNCCKLDAHELETEQGNYLRYATFWTPVADPPPADARYSNLLIQLEAESESYQTGYRLRLLISTQP